MDWFWLDRDPLKGYSSLPPLLGQDRIELIFETVELFERHVKHDPEGVLALIKEIRDYLLKL